jgi:Ca-activated chloride channel family protein
MKVLCNQVLRLLARSLVSVEAMRRQHLLAVSTVGVSLLVAPAIAASQLPEGGQAVFKSGVDLVSVSATVRDTQGRLVRGLAASDFEVLDRGERRAITQFRTDRAPLSLAILFDVSGSMDVADRFTAARFAAHHLLSWLEEGRDEAGLFAFDSRLQEVAPFTVDTRALNGALGEVDPFGATSLHDAIAEASARVARRPNPRRAVVVLTDGVDTASRLTPAEVSGVAAAIDVPVYVIATVLAIDDPGSARGTPQASRQAPPHIGTIEDLARWTGGVLHYASGPAATSRAARDVVDELRHVYLIAFEPGTTSGWHPIEIRTRNQKLKVRARGGYVAGAGHGSDS